MNGEIRTGDRYFPGGASNYSSQAIQSKLFQAPVKRNTPLMIRMSTVEEYPPSLKRRKISEKEW